MATDAISTSPTVAANDGQGIFDGDDVPVTHDRQPSRRHSAGSRLGAVITILGASTIAASVLGAVPWREPTLLIENMFGGFSACARSNGVLTPLVMRCDLAGVPLGMYQLDAGLSYPLGGLFQSMGMDAGPAWKLSVWLLLTIGFAALYWLARRIGSPLVATVVTLLFAIGATLTARSWAWYWCPVAVALLSLVLASAFVLIERASERRVESLGPAAVATTAAVVAVALEWQYAGVFALTVAVGALVVVGIQPGWPVRDRVLVWVTGFVLVGAVGLLLSWRLRLAGIEGQFESAGDDVRLYSVDLASFAAPDGRRSILGESMSHTGLSRLLVDDHAAARWLWPAPYLGAITLAVLIWLVVQRRRRGERTAHREFVVLLTVLAIGSVLLSLGPELQVGKAGPSVTLPWAPLWSIAPLEWMRYPWTWNLLTDVALLLLVAAMAPRWVPRGRVSNLGLVALLVAASLEFGSPEVLGAFTDPVPSVASASPEMRVSTDHPDVADFERGPMRELHTRLLEVDGVVVLLPWTNMWLTPHLGPEVGVAVRNVGIDRNLFLVEREAPVDHSDLEQPSGATVARLLETRWAAAVVLLDHIPNGGSVLRFASGELSRWDERWLRRKRRIEQDLRRDGYCIEERSWFSVATDCAGGNDDG